MHSSSTALRLALVAMMSAAAACDDVLPTGPAPKTGSPSFSAVGSSPPAPGGLVSIGSLEVWPWTGRDLDGSIADPLNLFFTGEADIVSLRAALMSLDGNRTAFGFPAAAPFDCTWKDAHGGVQTVYTSGAGWVGNAVQLECGDYAPVRFHIRLFDAGDAVAAAVHLDLLIPGTPEHQVISWELPEQLVMVDFLRSGLLAAPPSFEALTLPGGVQAIPKVIYDGIPDPLKVAIGFPPGPTAQPAVPVPSDGVATVLHIGTRVRVSAGEVDYGLAVPFNQVIPRPFCAQCPTDFVLVQGSVDLGVRTRVSADGELETHNTLRGDLMVTPIDIATGQPSGPTFPAQISAMDNTGVEPTGTRVNALLQRKALPPGVGFLSAHLLTGPNGTARFTTSETCD
jgi:hypothetical protein